MHTCKGKQAGSPRYLNNIIRKQGVKLKLQFSPLMDSGENLKSGPAAPVVLRKKGSRDELIKLIWFLKRQHPGHLHEQGMRAYFQNKTVSLSKGFK